VASQHLHALLELLEAVDFSVGATRHLTQFNKGGVGLLLTVLDRVSEIAHMKALVPPECLVK
jgi:hypothetical protein